MKKLISLVLSLFILTGCIANSDVKKLPVTTQLFTNINITSNGGNLSIISGDEFTNTDEDGNPINYTIEEDTLYISANGTSQQIIIPENYTYNSIVMNITDGEVIYKPVGTCSNLEINAEGGDITLSKIDVSDSSNLNITDSYLYLSGDLGINSKICCQEGYAKFKVDENKDYYNYVLDLSSDSYLNLGNYKYDSVAVHEQVFNRSTNYMNIKLESAKVVVNCNDDFTK